MFCFRTRIFFKEMTVMQVMQERMSSPARRVPLSGHDDDEERIDSDPSASAAATVAGAKRKRAGSGSTK